MTVAQRAAALAVLLAVNGVLVTFLLAGVTLLTALAVIGCALFAGSAYYGFGPGVAVGITLVVLPLVLATDSSPAPVQLLLAAGAGVGAGAALVMADASWWLRRDPRVDAAVIKGLATTLAPIWFVGAGLGVAAAALTRVDRLTIWLLPVGIVAASALVAAGVWAIRRRHRRRNPTADLRI